MPDLTQAQKAVAVRTAYQRSLEAHGEDTVNRVIKALMQSADDAMLDTLYEFVKQI